jgi:hypothetical protein
MITIQKVITLDEDGKATTYLTVDGTENGAALFSANPIISICPTNTSATLRGYDWTLSANFKTLTITGTSTNANKTVLVNASL